MEKSPWDVHPELLEDRLVAVATILRDVRHNAIPYHEQEKGDSNWGLGTRVAERSWFALRDAAIQYPWLNIINPSKHFVFAIGGVPFRFYKGLPEKPNTRVLARQFPEIRQHQHAFEFFQSETEYFWRFAVETDYSGEVLRIVVAQMSEVGDVKSTWDVPLSGKVTALSLVSSAKPSGVELPSPIVLGKKNKLKLVHGTNK